MGCGNIAGAGAFAGKGGRRVPKRTVFLWRFAGCYTALCGLLLQEGAGFFFYFGGSANLGALCGGYIAYCLFFRFSFYFVFDLTIFGFYSLCLFLGVVLCVPWFRLASREAVILLKGLANQILIWNP